MGSISSSVMAAAAHIESAFVRTCPVPDLWFPLRERSTTRGFRLTLSAVSLSRSSLGSASIPPSSTGWTDRATIQRKVQGSVSASVARQTSFDVDQATKRTPSNSANTLDPSSGRLCPSRSFPLPPGSFPFQSFLAPLVPPKQLSTQCLPRVAPNCAIAGSAALEANLHKPWCVNDDVFKRKKIFIYLSF